MNHNTNWIKLLNKQITIKVIHFKMDVSQGLYFFMMSNPKTHKPRHLSTSNPNTTKKVLVFIPHKFPWTIVIYQKLWVPLFNPNRSLGLKLLVWASLHILLLKLQSLGMKIISQLEKVLGVDINNGKKRNPRFCVALDPNQGWMAHLFIKDEEGIILSILVNYGRYPIHCHFCIHMRHLICSKKLAYS